MLWITQSLCNTQVHCNQPNCTDLHQLRNCPSLYQFHITSHKQSWDNFWNSPVVSCNFGQFRMVKKGRGRCGRTSRLPFIYLEKGRTLILLPKCLWRTFDVRVACSAGRCSSLWWAFSWEHCLHCCRLHQDWEWKHRVLQGWRCSQIPGKTYLYCISLSLSLLYPLNDFQEGQGGVQVYMETKKSMIIGSLEIYDNWKWEKGIESQDTCVAIYCGLGQITFSLFAGASTSPACMLWVCLAVIKEIWVGN